MYGFDAFYSFCLEVFLFQIVIFESQHGSSLEDRAIFLSAGRLIQCVLSRAGCMYSFDAFYSLYLEVFLFCQHNKPKNHYYYLNLLRVYTVVLADSFSLEFKRQCVSSCLQYSSQYSGRA